MLSRPQTKNAAWLERYGHQLPRLAVELAAMEREAVECEYPRVWHSMRYTNAIAFCPGVVLAVGFGLPSEARASFIAATFGVAQSGLQLLATGFSRDRRAWIVFIKSQELGRIKDMLRPIAPPIESWEEFSTW